VDEEDEGPPSKKIDLKLDETTEKALKKKIAAKGQVCVCLCVSAVCARKRGVLTMSRCVVSLCQFCRLGPLSPAASQNCIPAPLSIQKAKKEQKETKAPKGKKEAKEAKETTTEPKEPKDKAAKKEEEPKKEKKKGKKDKAAQKASTGAVIYLGHIPYGFFEEQMQGYFSQFGTVTRLRLSRSPKVATDKT
jgi:hypothetical protein